MDAASAQRGKDQRNVLAAICAALLAGLIATTTPASAEERVTVYVWRGYDAPTELLNLRFHKFFSRAFRNHDLIWENQPLKSRVLNLLARADIVYANTHSGFPRNPELGVPEQILKLEPPDGTANWKIDGIDAARLRRRVGANRIARLVVISGCDMFAQPPGGQRVLRIPEALGFRPNMRGRAFIGFDTKIPGRVGDRYFRIFFAHWTRPSDDGSYMTLDQARVAAAQFIRGWTDRHTDQALRNRNYMNRPDANLAEEMIIWGDKSLRMSDLMRVPGANGGVEGGADGGAVSRRRKPPCVTASTPTWRRVCECFEKVTDEEWSPEETRSMSAEWRESVMQACGD